MIKPGLDSGSRLIVIDQVAAIELNSTELYFTVTNHVVLVSNPAVHRSTWQVICSL